ncbi:MAG TPA: DUF4388 domain-containing protein [Anaeromyxobacteraceae bacterium]|nr:DUF4388 domain-containing protein [Anaeromyxobacteraceae bacterium]
MTRLYLDVDPHGRVAPHGEEARRALADRAGRFALLPTAADLLLALRTPPAGGPGPEARCRLAGDLAGFPLADLVAFVHQSKLSGILTVGSGGVERSVGFKDGEVRSARSEAPGERIGEVAVRLGYLTEAQAAEAALAGRPIGRTLVERGLISAKDLWKCFHEQVTVVFHALLLAREGTFHLADEAEGERSGVPLSVNTQSLLMDGIRRIDEMSLFRARIPGPQAFLHRREPRRAVRLERAEQDLLDLVDGRRRVLEVAREAHLSEFDATRILYHLAEAGYLEAADAPATAAASPQDRLAALVEGMNAVLREVCGAAAAHGGAEPFLAGVRAYLGDASSRFAPLWKRVRPRPAGDLDPDRVLGNLAALRGAVLRRLEPSGDPARLLHDGMREVAFFYLFLAGERLPREADDALGERVKRTFLELEDLR